MSAVPLRRIHPVLRPVLPAVLVALMAIAVVGGARAPRRAAGAGEAAVFPGLPTVGALLVKGHAQPICTASVVWSSHGDVLLTAAYCLGRTLRRNLTFAPAYYDGRAPLGMWAAERQIVPAGWFTRKNASAGANIDFAFLIVRGDVQRYTGAEIVASSSPAPARVRVVAYVNKRDRYPITCLRRPGTIMVKGECSSSSCAADT